MKPHFPRLAFGPAAAVIIMAILPPVSQAQTHFDSAVRTSVVPELSLLREAASASEPLELFSVESLEMAPPFQTVTTTNLFAQIAFGAGWTTVFSFMNVGAATATGTLILTDDFAQPLTAAFTSPLNASLTSSRYAFSIPAGGSQEIIASPVSSTDPTKTGWARVESSAGSFGGVATFQFAPGGVLSIIAGVLSASTTSAVTIPLDDNHPNQIDTGYAIANPGNTNLNIKLIYVNPDSSILMSVFPTQLNPLAPGAHLARYFWQDANNTSFVFRGSVVMIEQAGQPFSVVALTLNHGLLTAIPAVPGSAPNIK